MNWLSGGRIDTFKYYRVTWPELEVIDEIDGVVGCRILRSLGTQTKVSSELESIKDINIGNDAIRIESTSKLGNETETITHATLFPSIDSKEKNGLVTNAAQDLHSVLTIPQSAMLHSMLTIPEGTNAISYARKMLEELDIQVTASQSNAQLTTDHVFEMGTSKLEVINWLADYANFGSVDIDSFGGAVLKPYVSPSQLAPSRYLTDDENGIYSPVFTVEKNTFDIPNVVVLVSSTEDQTFTSVAEFNDPSSPLSTANRWEITYTETVDDIPSQEALDEKAKSRLLDKLQGVESAIITTPYLPDDLNEVWSFKSIKSDYEIVGSIYSREVQMVPGMISTTRIRRFWSG